QILHRLFSQVVINAVNLLFVEDAGDNLIQFARTGEAACEGFFQNDARPSLTRHFGFSKTCRAKVLNDNREKTRWSGKVEKPVAGGSVLLVKMVECLLEFLVGL